MAALDLAALGLQGQAGNRVLYAAFNGLSTARPPWTSPRTSSGPTRKLWRTP